jgi:replicative DNA helicase
VSEVAEQKYRHRITDFGAEGKDLVLQNYYNTMKQIDPPASFGWPYLDVSSGGILPGDFISIVGRPAMGKSFKMLYVAIHNWLAGKNVLFVSMEMNTLAIAQRVSSMYTHINLTQLKSATFSSHSLGLFRERIGEAQQETGKLYIVDGNLAADPEDIYTLAVQLKCSLVLVDGGYLLRNRNPRLGRYEKVAENVEGMKRFSSDLDLGTLASFQFSREATKKKKQEKAGLEDIGYSDAIGQISTIALGLMQEDGIETMKTRLVDVMKGRNGEIGQFRIKWDFTLMDFSEVQEEDQKQGYDTSSI